MNRAGETRKPSVSSARGSRGPGGRLTSAPAMRRDHTPALVSREEPPLLGRLPEQYFTRILGRGARRARSPARASSTSAAATRTCRRRRTRSRRCARRRARPRPGRPRLPAVPGRARAAGGDRRALRGRPRRRRSTPSARSRSSRARRPGSCSLRAAAPARRRRSWCPTPATRTTCRASRSPARAPCRCRSTASAGWQPDFDAVRGDAAALALLNYPSNPCAVCERAGHVRGGRRLRARDAARWLVHDLAYGFLAFDGRRARSVLEVEGAREVAAELWSPSKVYGMAGLARRLPRRQRRARRARAQTLRGPRRRGRLHAACSAGCRRR